MAGANVKMAALVLLLLIITGFDFQEVKAVTVSCPKAVDASHLVLNCNVSGSSGEEVKVRIESFNGVDVHESFLPFLRATKVQGNTTETFYCPEKTFISVPFNVSVGLSGPMSQFLEAVALDSDRRWVVYNKVNTITLEFIHKNGTREDRRINVYISGRVPSPLDDRDVRNSLLNIIGSYILLAALVIGYQVYRFIRWNPLESGERGVTEEKPSPLRDCRKSFAISALTGLGIGLFLAPWVLYFLASPPRMLNDMRLYLPTTAMAGLVVEWLVFVDLVEKSGKPYLLKNPPITGVEWISLSILVLGGRTVAVGFIAFVLLFLASMDRTLNRFMVRASTVLSIGTALVLAFSFRADLVFVVGLLTLAFLHPYLIKAKVENAASLEEIDPALRTPDAREILNTFEKVLRERRFEGD